MSILFKNDYGFYVMGLREHIDRLHGADCKTRRAQTGKIPYQAFRAAGNIDEPVAAENGDG